MSGYINIDTITDNTKQWVCLVWDIEEGCRASAAADASTRSGGGGEE